MEVVQCFVSCLRPGSRQEAEDVLRLSQPAGYAGLALPNLKAVFPVQDVGHVDKSMDSDHDSDENNLHDN